MILDECVWGDVAGNESEGWGILRKALSAQRKATDENHFLHIGGGYWKRKAGAMKGGRFMECLFALNAGLRIKKENDDAVDEAERKWKATTGLCCDTDHWALALAEVSGTRCLVSYDEGLKSDFTNLFDGVTICRGVVNRPRELVKKLKMKK